MRVRNSKVGFWEFGFEYARTLARKVKPEQRRLCGPRKLYYDRTGSITSRNGNRLIGVASANSPGALFTDKDGSVRVVD